MHHDPYSLALGTDLATADTGDPCICNNHGTDLPMHFLGLLLQNVRTIGHLTSS